MTILVILGILFLLVGSSLIVYDFLAKFKHIGPTISYVIYSWMKVHIVLAIIIETLFIAGAFVLGLHFLGVFGE